MEEDGRPATPQFRQQPAKALRGAGIDFALGRNPLVATAPTRIRVAAENAIAAGGATLTPAGAALAGSGDVWAAAAATSPTVEIRTAMTIESGREIGMATFCGDRLSERYHARGARAVSFEVWPMFACFRNCTFLPRAPTRSTRHDTSAAGES
jgi:hypothetical protein